MRRILIGLAVASVGVIGGCTPDRGRPLTHVEKLASPWVAWNFRLAVTSST